MLAFTLIFTVHRLWNVFYSSGKQWFTCCWILLCVLVAIFAKVIFVCGSFYCFNYPFMLSCAWLSSVTLPCWRVVCVQTSDRLFSQSWLKLILQSDFTFIYMINCYHNISLILRCHGMILSPYMCSPFLPQRWLTWICCRGHLFCCIWSATSQSWLTLPCCRMHLCQYIWSTASQSW